MECNGINQMFGLQIVGFYIKYFLIERLTSLHNNGYRLHIAVGRKLDLFMKNIDLISLEKEAKEDNIQYKLGLDGLMG